MMVSKAWRVLAIVEMLVIVAGIACGYMYLSGSMPATLKDALEAVACLGTLVWFVLSPFGVIFWGIVMYESRNSSNSNSRLSDDRVHTGGDAR